VAVDGNKMLKWPYRGETVVKGDTKVAEISAASIVAKVTRDRELVALDKIYPEYGFAGHKGYATAKHIEAIKKYGSTEIHRRSFEPIKGLLACEQMSLIDLF
jgi:ribonuclease HII